MLDDLRREYEARAAPLRKQLQHCYNIRPPCTPVLITEPGDTVPDFIARQIEP